MVKEKLSQEKAYRIMLRGYPDVLDMKQMCEILGISLKTGYGLIQENRVSKGWAVIQNPKAIFIELSENRREQRQRIK